MENKITRFGYIINKNSVDEKTIDDIKKDLTVKPFKYGKFNKFAKNNTFPLYLDNGNYISIPKYYGIQQFGQPKCNKLETYAYPKTKMKYLGKLRPNQEIIVNKIIKGFEKNKGGILIAGCGSGKTNMAIYIACHYQLKTLFIVHKDFLKNQAIDRVKSVTNITKVGIIQQKKTEYEYPFVVGMVQSLAKINYDDKIFKDFGLIIIDEVHHMGAKNFSKVYQKMSSKYMLGISADKKRNDGMFKIINWYMGPFLHVEEQKPNDMVVVKRFHYKTSNKERVKTIVNRFTDEPDRSTMTTNLIHIKKRNRFILNIIKELFDQGKNILFLSGRLKQVRLLYKLINQDKYMMGCVGKYIGGMSEDELKKSATKQIIIATYDMAQEGLDIENLNAVIFGTPKSSIKQSVGRILRKEIYEEHPIVIDLIDICNQIYCKQANTRMTHYQQQHYNIQDFYVADYNTKNHFIYNDEKAIHDALIKIPKNTKKHNKTKKHDKTKKYNKKFIPIDIDKLEFLD